MWNRIRCRPAGGALCLHSWESSLLNTYRKLKTKIRTRWSCTEYRKHFNSKSIVVWSRYHDIGEYILRVSCVDPFFQADFLKFLYGISLFSVIKIFFALESWSSYILKNCFHSYDRSPFSKISLEGFPDT